MGLLQAPEKQLIPGFRESAFVSIGNPHPRRSPDADSAVLTALSRLGYNHYDNQRFASTNLTLQA